MSGTEAVDGAGFWRGRRVLVTGHTGFKGAWLSRWLLRLGAEVTGYALAPVQHAPLFGQLGLEARLTHRTGDIRDGAALARVVRGCAPEIVFHLAAQPLVLQGYAEPVETWSVNVMGTVTLLDALRALAAPVSVVCVTTDKVYADRPRPHRESDRLGGHDPYAASKAACELVADSYRAAFLNDAGIRLATARAGNVIGGGDWAQNRLVPDIVRALMCGRPVTLRNPRAVRPWQHVLEPLGGYLRLGRRLHEEGGERVQGAWNFGPGDGGHRTTSELVETALRHWPGRWQCEEDTDAPVETAVLELAIDKAASELGWAPVWPFETTVGQTMDWYRQIAGGTGAVDLTDRQIATYQAEAAL